MEHLFRPLNLRDVTIRNRIGMSPMCMYSATDGRPDEWHLVHLGARAAGGAGLVITEATAIEPAGCISPRDTGIWDDAHVDAWRPIAAFLREQGAVPAMQIAHAGRKAHVPERVGPSAVAFSDDYPEVKSLSRPGLARLLARFVEGADRVRAAGFDALEIHMAHGYLLQSFLSPLSNRREDDYGGDRERRMRFPLEVAKAVREAWPDRLPLLVRISATDWVEGAWDLDDSVAFAAALRDIGVDLVDCSAGGAVPDAVIPVEPGYQVPFAERIRAGAGIATAAVGLITEPGQADAIVRDGRADLVLLGRELLRDPHWPHRAALALGHEAEWPAQYARAAPTHSPTAIPS